MRSFLWTCRVAFALLIGLAILDIGEATIVLAFPRSGNASDTDMPLRSIPTISWGLGFTAIGGTALGIGFRNALRGRGGPRTLPSLVIGACIVALGRMVAARHPEDAWLTLLVCGSPAAQYYWLRRKATFQQGARDDVRLP